MGNPSPEPPPRVSPVWRLNTRGLVLFFILLFLFWPLCWIPWLVPACRQDSAVVSAPLTDAQKRKVKLAFSLTWRLGLGLLLWPFASFMCGFMFDDPHVPEIVTVFCLLAALSVVFYPALLIVGFSLAYRAARRDESTHRVRVLASLPVFSALWWPLFPVIIWAVVQMRRDEPD